MLVRLRHGYRQWLASGGYLLFLFVGAQFETPAGWRLSAAAIAVLALVAWIMVLRRVRAVVDTPTSNIASAAQGYVELIGKGVALAGIPLLTPLRPMPCLWYRYKVERKQDDKWVTESSGESTDSFLLDDGSGQCLVDPEGAEILPRMTESWFEDDYRYTQAVMIGGEEIYALGAFRTWGGDSLVLDRNEDIKQLLAEWKKNQPRLLERFDLDGNGVLDMREWQLARSQARREVERNHRELRAAPDTHMLGRPEDGRMFLISSMPAEKLARYYLRWAFAHLTIFLAALAGFAYLQQF
jgi:hypothetical protein